MKVVNNVNHCWCNHPSSNGFCFQKIGDEKMKDGTKRFIFWPLHDNAINAIMKVGKWNAIGATQTEPEPDKPNYLCRRPPVYKSTKNDCGKPMKYPKFFKQMNAEYKYSDAEEKSEVARFMR